MQGSVVNMYVSCQKAKLPFLVGCCKKVQMNHDHLYNLANMLDQYGRHILADGLNDAMPE